MRRSFRSAGCAVFFLIAVFSFTSARAGTVQFLAQSLSVDATTDVTVGTAMNSDADSKPGTSTGQFAATADASATASSPAFSITGHSTATQDSLLSPTLIRFSGRLETHADTTGSPDLEFHFNANAQAKMMATFILDNGRKILVDGQTGGGNVDPHQNFGATLELTRTDDGQIFDLRAFGERELPPGTYELDFKYAISPPSSVSPESTFFNFTVNLHFDNTPTPIPLPPAALSFIAVAVPALLRRK